MFYNILRNYFLDLLTIIQNYFLHLRLNSQFEVSTEVGIGNWHKKRWAFWLHYPNQNPEDFNVTDNRIRRSPWLIYQRLVVCSPIEGISQAYRYIYRREAIVILSRCKAIPEPWLEIERNGFTLLFCPYRKMKSHIRYNNSSALYVEQRKSKQRKSNNKT